MPRAESWAPRRMFPPPMTIPTCTPVPAAAATTSAVRPPAATSIPCPPGSHRDSPESLSITRLNGPTPARGAAAGCAASLTELDPREALHAEAGETEALGSLHQVGGHGLVRVLHERLLQERPLGEQLL